MLEYILEEFKSVEEACQRIPEDKVLMWYTDGDDTYRELNLRDFKRLNKGMMNDPCSFIMSLDLECFLAMKVNSDHGIETSDVWYKADINFSWEKEWKWIFETFPKYKFMGKTEWHDLKENFTNLPFDDCRRGHPKCGDCFKAYRSLGA